VLFSSIIIGFLFIFIARIFYEQSWMYLFSYSFVWLLIYSVVKWTSLTFLIKESQKSFPFFFKSFLLFCSLQRVAAASSCSLDESLRQWYCVSIRFFFLFPHERKNPFLAFVGLFLFFERLKI